MLSLEEKAFWLHCGSIGSSEESHFSCNVCTVAIDGTKVVRVGCEIITNQNKKLSIDIDRISIILRVIVITQRYSMLRIEDLPEIPTFTVLSSCHRGTMLCVVVRWPHRSDIDSKAVDAQKLQASSYADLIRRLVRLNQGLCRLLPSLRGDLDFTWGIFTRPTLYQDIRTLRSSPSWSLSANIQHFTDRLLR